MLNDHSSVAKNRFHVDEGLQAGVDDALVDYSRQRSTIALPIKLIGAG